MDDNEIGEIVRPRLERWLHDLDEVVDGEGDGAVAIASARLEGAENVSVPLDHLALVRLHGLVSGARAAEDHPVFERVALWVSPATAVDLRGRVVDVLGDPVPAATVWLTRDDDEVLRRTVADGQGLFQLRLPAVDWRVRVHASAPGLAMEPVVADGPSVILVMRDAAAVTGVVRDAAGLPVRGADVVVINPVEREWSKAWFAAFATTDAAGAFRVPAVPVGPAQVRAWSDGRGKGPVNLDLAADAALDLRFDQEVAPPRLLVVADLQPATRALSAFTVASSWPLPHGLRRLPLREDGTALLPRLPFSHEVALAVPGMTVAPERILCRAGEEDDLEFRAQPRPQVARTAGGNVVDASGASVANLDVAVIDRARRLLARGRTAADGSFRLPLPRASDGTVELGVHVGDRPVRGNVDAFGWLWTRASDVDVPVPVRVAHGSAIAGVATARGEPLAFAEFTIMRVHTVAPRRAGDATEKVVHVGTGTTDGRGAMWRSGLGAGRYRLCAVASDGRAVQADVEVGAGERVEIKNFEPVPVGRIEGRRIDPAGQPVRGVRHALWSSVGTVLGPRASAGITNRDGRFRLWGLPAGEYTVALQHGQGADGALVAEVIADQATTVQLQAPR
jgi:hypothetical protein